MFCGVGAYGENSATDLGSYEDYEMMKIPQHTYTVLIHVGNNLRI